MDKVIVLGSPGAGKSTFSRRLSELTGLPLTYLDMVYHRPDRTHITHEEFDSRLEEIVSGDRWLIDGNFYRTIEMRLKACDTAFLFDLPADVCLAGVRSRIGKPRVDMPWTDHEIEPAFEKLIRNFPTIITPGIYLLFEKYSDKNIIVFKTREQADEFLLAYNKE